MSEGHDTPAPGAFALVENLLTLVTDQVAVKRRLHALHDALAAVDVAQRELAAERTKFTADQTAARAALSRQENDLDERSAAIAVAEGLLSMRAQRIAELELEWKFIGEPDLVKSGLQNPLYGTPLEKAKRAFGISADALTAPASLRPAFLNHDADRLDVGGEPFPAHVSLTRSP
jgi:hypothetical protein